MKVKMHSFGICWTEHGVNTFVAGSQEELEENVTKYLRDQEEFNSFLKALKNNGLEEEEKQFVASLLRPEITPVITREIIERLDELDIDYLKHAVGQISDWKYSDEEVDLTKVLAQRAVIAGTSVDEGSQKPRPFNEWQKVMMQAYGGGDYKGFSPETVHQVAEGLFKFLVAELSTSEDCEDMDEALKRVDRATAELHNVADALAHAIITPSAKTEIQKPKTKKPSGPGM